MLPAAILFLALLGSATASFNSHSFDIGYGNDEKVAFPQVPRGLYDVRCVGEARDYCRYVGDVGSTSNPVRFACAIDVQFKPPFVLTAFSSQADIEANLLSSTEALRALTTAQSLALEPLINKPCPTYPPYAACKTATQWYYRAGNKCDTCLTAADKVDCLNCLINTVYHDVGYDACTAKLATGDATYYTCVTEQKDQYGGPRRCQVCSAFTPNKAGCYQCVKDNINHNGVAFCAPALTTAQANQAYYNCVKDAKDAPTNVLGQCAVCAKSSTPTTCFKCVVDYKWTNGGKCPV